MLPQEPSSMVCQLRCSCDQESQRDGKIHRSPQASHVHLLSVRCCVLSHPCACSGCCGGIWEPAKTVSTNKCLIQTQLFSIGYFAVNRRTYKITLLWVSDWDMLNYFFCLSAYLAMNILMMNSLSLTWVKTPQKPTRYKGCHDNQCVTACTSEKKKW